MQKSEPPLRGRPPRRTGPPRFPDSAGQTKARRTTAGGGGTPTIGFAVMWITGWWTSRVRAAVPRRSAPRRVALCCAALLHPGVNPKREMKNGRLTNHMTFHDAVPWERSASGWLCGWPSASEAAGLARGSQRRFRQISHFLRVLFSVTVCFPLCSFHILLKKK